MDTRLPWCPTRGSLTSPSYLVRNRTLGPPLENNPEIPPDPETKALTDKFLLKKTDDMAEKVRVLLLSATPYKLYSTLDELGDANDDSHYQEFLDVMGFLNGHDPHFHDIWMDYSKALSSR